MEAPYVLETFDLRHSYGKRAALGGVSLRLPPGRIYGLLGRNGAGKTTLLNIISASMRQSSGGFALFGLPARERAGVLSNLCYVREKSAIPGGARLRDALYGCSRVFPNWDGAYALRLAAKFGLDLNKKYKQLSRGMESSIGLVIGLASRAPLTVFDEPSLGLDAAAREFFYDELARDLRACPRTLIISTHLIDEVSRLFEDVIIMDRGLVLRHQPMGELLGGYASLVGPRAAVEASCRGRKALHIDEIGDTVRFIVEKGDGAVADGVASESVPLQRLFVLLTEEGGGPNDGV